MEFSLEFSLESCYEAWSPTSDGSCKPKNPGRRSATDARQTSDLALLRWLEGPKLDWHSDHSLCARAARPHTTSALTLTLEPQPQSLTL